jgi:G6PDH family F420-dependent oxidoreductase
MITGSVWPAKEIRNERLKESADIIRKLLNGQQVTFHGHVQVKNARLFTLPEYRPPLFCCALSAQTAAWAGEWSDGLLTTAGHIDDVINKKQKFENAGGKGKPVYAQFAFSYASSKEKAIDGAYDQWRNNLIGKDKLDDLETPEQFDQASENISREEVEEKIDIFTSMEDILERADEYLQTGIHKIILHNVNTNQEQFIQDFGKHHIRFKKAGNNVRTHL